MTAIKNESGYMNNDLFLKWLHMLDNELTRPSLLILDSCSAHGTLRHIALAGCSNIDSKAIQIILVECGALGEFSVSWSKNEDWQRRNCISLEDAIELPWTCTRIQEVKLTVAIPDQPIHRPLDNAAPYYDRPPPTLLSALERLQLENLEALYRQVGALTELRRPDFQAVYFDPQSRRPILGDIKVNSFPGMLSLACETTGRPGYLLHMAGLTKLRILEGSVQVTTTETKVTVGMTEAKWMGKHWSALVVAHFVGKPYKLPEHFRWLKEQSDKKGRNVNFCAPIY
ncbi:hypothetical protein BGZ95_007360 [Linnemannia exigua]|uniref:Uncharacterized protein n=1 Tax=Linnemannia exigua TaxID=604196 RepID=A0AAD4DF59_9FUNG|nr:hypothetical protein BGZ95_007360 [Linnemannia exigua]